MIIRVIGDEWMPEERIVMSIVEGKAVRVSFPQLMKKLGITNMNEYSVWHADASGRKVDPDRPMDKEKEWNQQGVKQGGFVYIRKMPYDSITFPGAAAVASAESTTATSVAAPKSCSVTHQKEEKEEEGDAVARPPPPPPPKKMAGSATTTPSGAPPPPPPKKVAPRPTATTTATPLPSPPSQIPPPMERQQEQEQQTSQPGNQRAALPPVAGFYTSLKKTPPPQVPQQNEQHQQHQEASRTPPPPSSSVPAAATTSSSSGLDVLGLPQSTFLYKTAATPPSASASASTHAHHPPVFDEVSPERVVAGGNITTSATPHPHTNAATVASLPMSLGTLAQLQQDQDQQWQHYATAAPAAPAAVSLEQQQQQQQQQHQQLHQLHQHQTTEQQLQTNERHFYERKLRDYEQNEKMLRNTIHELESKVAALEAENKQHQLSNALQPKEKEPAIARVDEASRALVVDQFRSFEDFLRWKRSSVASTVSLYQFTHEGMEAVRLRQQMEREREVYGEAMKQHRTAVERSVEDAMLRTNKGLDMLSSKIDQATAHRLQHKHHQ